jgi:hypothetical protein
MDGDIVYPGDLHGRVIVTGTVSLAWDGNALSALAGEDIVVGVSGFGDSVHEALRDLAHNLIREAVWVEIPEGREIEVERFRPSPTGTIQTDIVELRRVDEYRLCAFVRLDQGLPIGVAGIGPSVHEALQALAKELVSKGVWVDVTARRKWQFETPSPASMLPHSDFGDSECCGLLQGIVRGDAGQIVCNECGAVVRTLPPVELQKTLREMELELDVTTDLCPRCRAANIFPGFTEIEIYTCRQCGAPINIEDRS